MFGGGGGMDPRKMQQMMEQMGVDFGELDAEEIVIRLGDGEELYFDNPEVTKIEAQGETTYQLVGNPESREAGETGGPAVDEDGPDVAQQDVELVVERTGASEDAAREALENTGGDLAAAIDMLE